ncbi:MAG: endospore germination permease [Sporomusaceae bacterium]|nr:endospore germination permease [Sporomusaceae bacterium]
MIESGRISNIQAAMLAVMSLTIIGHLILLTVVIGESHQDGWIAAIIGTILALIGIISLVRLSQKFPGLTLVEILFSRFSWAGKLIGVLYLVYFYVMTVLAVRLFAETYKKIMEETPIIAFVTVILFLTAYIVYSGIETMGRLNQIILPVVVIIAFAVVLLTLGNKDYSNLLPILGKGFSPVALGALSVMGWFGEFVIMGMICPYVQCPSRLVKTGIYAALITLVFFLGPVTGPVAMFGPVEAAKMELPTFSEVRYITAGDVLYRFDTIAILFWTTGLTIRTAIFFYGLSLGTAQAFGLKSYRPIVIPFAWLIGVGAVLFVKNYQELTDFIFHTYVPLNLIMGVAIPLLLLLVSPFVIKKISMGR